VRDAKYSDVKDEIPPVFFTPYRQEDRIVAMNFYARTEGDPEQLIAAVAPMIGRIDSSLPVDDLKTLEQQVRENVVIDRIISTLAAAFAALATALAAIGLYGVLAYAVAQRSREIGLRMALGAGRGDVRRMVLRQMARMLALGSVVGLLAATGVGRAAESLLFGVDGFDPVVLGAVTVLLSAIAFAAAVVPALKASRVDPMEALRYD